MQLTLYTDYSLRLLLYLGAYPEGATISQVAEAYGISRNHLVKVAHNLGKYGYLRNTRGKSGGLKLGMAPDQVVIGQVVRSMEDMRLVECFNPGGGRCPITPVCRLKHVLFEAQQAFLETLDRYTLADLLLEPDTLRVLLRAGPAVSVSQEPGEPLRVLRGVKSP